MMIEIEEGKLQTEAREQPESSFASISNRTGFFRWRSTNGGRGQNEAPVLDSALEVKVGP